MSARVMLSACRMQLAESPVYRFCESGVDGPPLGELDTDRERRVLLLHGTYDEVVTIDGARLARDVLEAAGLEPEYHELSIGHQVSPESLALVRGFLERVLRRTPISSPES